MRQSRANIYIFKLWKIRGLGPEKLFGPIGPKNMFSVLKRVPEEISGSLSPFWNGLNETKQGKYIYFLIM